MKSKMSAAAPARARFLALASASATAILALAPQVHAQEAAQVDEVVVTATRLQATGFTAPTPTTVIGAEELQASAKPNLFNAITELPSLQGSTGVGTGTGGTSGGTNGLSSFSMRGLGAIRTLTLLDGQRVVPANVSGVPDISMFPQLLVNRVDVVTGGASASYGSDAVAGVINFFTDKTFDGFKYNLQSGITTYGDGESHTVQLAAGKNFFDDRLHVQASAEWGKEGGIGPNGVGCDPGPRGRTWYKCPGFLNRSIAATPAGQPQITPILYAQDYQFTKYGLITAGPLQGTAFDVNGNPFPFQYGSNGVPSRAANGAVSNCVSPFCQGGDLSGNVGNGTSVRGLLEREVYYTRASFDVTEHLNVFATANIARVVTQNTPNTGAFKNANLTIQCANPFVPAAVKTACTANNITSFQFGTTNANFPVALTVHPVREQKRFVVGASGDFELFGKNWTWDTYYQDGQNDTTIRVKNITLTPRYNAAINAVLLNGQIVCADANARAAGCQPLNVFGGAVIPDNVWRYVAPVEGPRQVSHQEQDAFAFTLNGIPFNNWAGEVAIAAGFEWRKESYSVVGDVYGNGLSASTPFNANYPQDSTPSMNFTLGNNWYAGNFHNGAGEFDVKEVFGEVGMPLFDNEGLGKMDLQLAARGTDYSTSGRVSTWKAGLSWATPVSGLRFRTVASRDIRAPNLSELFAAPTVANGTVINRLTGVSVTVLNETVGNPNLTAEEATTVELGVAWTNPSWFPGLSASIDAYDIQVDGRIASISAQQTVDFCQQANQTAYCAFFNLNGTASNPNKVTVQAFNLATSEVKGVDTEVSWRSNLADWNMGLAGNLTLRGLATYTDSFIEDPGIPGQIASNRAGENTGSVPKWKLLAIQNYVLDKFNITFTERWFSDGVINNAYIECQTGCPAPTTNHPTISNNQMKGALYVDVGLGYKFSNWANVFFKVDNIADRDPEPVYSNAPNNLGANPALYDTFGRTYRIGIRGEF